MVNKFFAALNDVWREESQHYEQAINRRGEESLRMQIIGQLQLNSYPGNLVETYFSSTKENIGGKCTVYKHRPVGDGLSQSVRRNVHEHTHMCMCTICINMRY